MESTIGSRIREQRKAKGLSVAELAERTHLSESLIEKLERGDRGDRIPASTAFAIADLFGCDVRWLVNGDAEPIDDDMDTSSVSERIEYLGKCAGSLRRLDKAAGLPFGHAHALIGRIANPHLSTLHKIADGAGVARSWVTNGDGPTPDADAVRDAVARACDEPIPVDPADPSHDEGRPSMVA